MNASDRRLEEVVRYNRLCHLKKASDNMKDTFGFTGSFSKEAAKGRQYAMTEYKEYRQMVEDYGDDTAYSAVNTYSKICHSISYHRRMLREYTACGVLEDAAKMSLQYAAAALTMTFPSMNWSCSTGSELSFTRKTTYYGDHTVGIKITWHRKVKEKNIEMVKAGDGWRFIMDATEVKMPRLNDEGYVAYKVDALKVKSKQAEIEEGWVLAYYSEDRVISAFHAELGRAESLLNRRIKDMVANLLLD